MRCGDEFFDGKLCCFDGEVLAIGDAHCVVEGEEDMGETRFEGPGDVVANDTTDGGGDSDWA